MSTLLFLPTLVNILKNHDVGRHYTLVNILLSPTLVNILKNHDVVTIHR